MAKILHVTLRGSHLAATRSNGSENNLYGLKNDPRRSKNEDRVSEMTSIGSKMDPYEAKNHPYYTENNPYESEEKLCQDLCESWHDPLLRQATAGRPSNFGKEVRIAQKRSSKELCQLVSYPA